MRLFRLKVFAICLLAMFVGSGLMVAISIPSAKPVAGCHGQSHSKSTPQPDYQCCVAGHNQALQPNVCDALLISEAGTAASSMIVIVLERPVSAFFGPVTSSPPLIALRI